jgi:hypothetical protein
MFGSQVGELARTELRHKIQTHDLAIAYVRVRIGYPAHRPLACRSSGTSQPRDDRAGQTPLEPDAQNKPLTASERDALERAAFPVRIADQDATNRVLDTIHCWGKELSATMAEWGSAALSRSCSSPQWGKGRQNQPFWPP